jgi:hypothetical protein
MVDLCERRKAQLSAKGEGKNMVLQFYNSLLVRTRDSTCLKGAVPSRSFSAWRRCESAGRMLGERYKHRRWGGRRNPLLQTG